MLYLGRAWGSPRSHSDGGGRAGIRAEWSGMDEGKRRRNILINGAIKWLASLCVRETNLSPTFGKVGDRASLAQEKPPLRGLGVQVCHSTPLLHLLQSAAPIWGEGVPRLPNNQGVSEHVQTPKGQKSIICTKSLSSLLCSFCLITALYNFLLFYHEGPRFKQNLTRQKR